MTGVSECSQQRGNLKDNRYIFTLLNGQVGGLEELSGGTGKFKKIPRFSSGDCRKDSGSQRLFC
ncbi:hypothetical protein ACK3F5_01515 [Photorhabdus asymbiotica UENP]